MSFAKIYSAQVVLLKAHLIEVEVDISRGLYALSIVGLPDKAVEEAKDRISAAIKHTGYVPPKQKNHKLVISLAPAELKKEGAALDVAMALGYLLASGDIRFDPEGKLFLGELSLQGELRKVRGILPMVLEAKERGILDIYVPDTNAAEAALVRGINVYGARTLKEIIDSLNTKKTGTAKASTPLSVYPTTILAENRTSQRTTFSDIRGQLSAKRGLEIAAAGGHNIALYGPPGTGKTLLAKALADILPPLTFDEVLEVTSIHSTVTHLGHHLITEPPFRSPHHTASYVAVVGGGASVRPGEVTLAHRGVLFLDEFPEFDRRVVEALREPLEERVVSIARARGTAQFPAAFILVAAFNPCPCGHFGSKKPCTCSPLEVERYRKKLSGPLLDRIDMWIEVRELDFETLTGNHKSESTEGISRRVKQARKRQMDRFSDRGTTYLNSHMNVRDIEKLIPLRSNLKTILSAAVTNLHLSPRAYHRVLKLSRTIADLAESDDVEEAHVLEALRYRPKELA